MYMRSRRSQEKRWKFIPELARRRTPGFVGWFETPLSGFRPVLDPPAADTKGHQAAASQDQRRALAPAPHSAPRPLWAGGRHTATQQQNHLRVGERWRHLPTRHCKTEAIGKLESPTRML